MYAIYQNYKNEARQKASLIENHDDRLDFARAFCRAAIQSYWNSASYKINSSFSMMDCPLAIKPIQPNIQSLAATLGELISKFPAEDAGFLIGSVYTAMLPSALRSKYGAYYTPPPLIARLLELAENNGVDFKSARIIDPACGGGAFLAPIALKVIESSPNVSPETIVNNINDRIRGIELDPFAAWISHVLLEAVILPYCSASNIRLKKVIQVGDALNIDQTSKYDLIIGNPPYGKITLNSELRKKYSRSLFGHANLYGLFVDLSLRIVESNGLIALITPTSFLGGQYFKKLRRLLTDNVSPCHFEFVKDRHGVFEDVQQETIITIYKDSEHHRTLEITELLPEGLNTFRVGAVGQGLIKSGDAPWVLPRDPADVAFLAQVLKNSNRFIDMGLHISTGPLVWNQHKKMLNHNKNGLPLIWASHVTNSGFAYSSDAESHGDYVARIPNKHHLITSRECILVKRTTSKEQSRRILAAVLPDQFIIEAGGVYIENHLNIIDCENTPIVSFATVAALLNSRIIDRIFRCINGSTAVSAYELNTLPLPDISHLKKLERLIMEGTEGEALERAIEEAYGFY
ncbi:HsdM family class I SAM-dependent methyltransferase [Pseudomonas shirazica]|uniref:HsdM family class I SAM-dependent methyltransferase n=1 Tax=Pseudomonas shirazica TaxID=1940636 RepID=UPI00111A49B6|nr:Eco57I restriction-modification methylase domain-containing protein [Pseudomonas shirazica]